MRSTNAAASEAKTPRHGLLTPPRGCRGAVDPRVRRRRGGAGREYTETVPVERVAWLLTVIVALVTALSLWLSGYTGYAELCVVVGASAAINLR